MSSVGKTSSSSIDGIPGAGGAAATDAARIGQYHTQANQVFWRPLIYMMIGGLLATDLLWGARIGLSIGGWWKSAIATGFLLVLSSIYRSRSRGIADSAESAALWIAFTAAGCVLTYLCATCAMPLQDARLAGIDHAVGFDWLAWRHVMLTWAPLRWALALAYASLLSQIVFSILFLSATGLSQRSFELLLLAALALLPTTLISALCPVLGPFAIFGGGEQAYLPHVLALRAGGPWHFDLVTMQGIITMPSYHTVLAVLFTYAHRHTGLAGWGVAGLNGFMLLSILPIGGHYFADMVCGGMIALVCILGLRRLDLSPQSRLARSLAATSPALPDPSSRT